MDRFLSSQRVLYKDFSSFVQRFSARIKAHAEQMAAANGRALIHLPSPKESKEERVRQFIEREQLTEGLVCVLSYVEPCRSFSIRGAVQRVIHARAGLRTRAKKGRLAQAAR